MPRPLVFSLLAVLGSSALITACGSSSNSPSSSSSATTVEPTADTQAFQLSASGYETWEQFPENTSPKLSPAHWNMYVVAYYNDKVDASEKAGTMPLIDGSIIVKENFKAASDKDPQFLTVMAKKGANWYWYEQTPDGKIMAPNGGTGLQGYDLSACSGCHKAQASNDYVYTHKFSGVPEGGSGAGGSGAGGRGTGGSGTGGASGGAGGAAP